MNLRDFFLDWAVRDASKAHPASLIRLMDSGKVTMGFVPNDPDGTVIELFAKPLVRQ